MPIAPYCGLHDGLGVVSDVFNPDSNKFRAHSILFIGYKRNYVTVILCICSYLKNKKNVICTSLISNYWPEWTTDMG